MWKDEMDDEVIEIMVIGSEVESEIIENLVVEIEIENLERIFEEGEGKIVDKKIWKRNEMREEEEEKGSVGKSVGIERRGMRMKRRIKIGIVEVEKREVKEREGKVRWKEGIERIEIIKEKNSEVIVEEKLIIDKKEMKIESRGNVIIEVENDIKGEIVFFGGNGRKMVGMCLIEKEKEENEEKLKGEGMDRKEKWVRKKMMCIDRELGGEIEGKIIILERKRKREMKL